MPSGWVIRDRGDLDPGWIDIQGPGLQRLNLSAKHGSPEWRTLYALASALLAQAPAVRGADHTAVMRQALDALAAVPLPVEHALPFSNVCDCTQCGSVRAIKSAKAILRAAVAQ